MLVMALCSRDADADGCKLQLLLMALVCPRCPVTVAASLHAATFH